MKKRETLNPTYYGENISSKTDYRCIKKELQDKIEFIQFMGYSPEDKGLFIQLGLRIRFKDGTDKEFMCEQNEDGSWEADAQQKVLKQADEYLATLIKTVPNNPNL